MRPTANAESALRTPLNQIIGRESHVRLLRVLALRDHPIRSADLARLTGLDPAGVRRALDALVHTGICVEGHDLAASKLAAFREKDRDFVRPLVAERMIKPRRLVHRLQRLPVDEKVRARVLAWVHATVQGIAD